MPTAPPAGPSVFAPDLVFNALGNPQRRRLLMAVSDGKGKASSQLAPLIGRRQDATLKHLIELREAGLVTMSRDPGDERRQLYMLHPAIKVQHTEAGWEMDFGCGTVRWQ